VTDLCCLRIAAELMAGHTSLDAATRSSTAPVDVRFPSGAAVAAARQQQVLVDQLQQQQQQQRLLSSLGGILSSSGLPINANQLQVCMSNICTLFNQLNTHTWHNL